MLYWGQFVEREKAIARLDALNRYKGAGTGGCRQMKKNYVVIIFGIIFAAGLFVYFLKPWAGQKPHESSSNKATVKADTNSGNQQNTENKPAAQNGKSEDQDEEEAPTVEIPIDKQRMLGVKTVEVAIKPLQHVIRTVGRIEYDEKRLSTINTKIEGWIERLYVDYTGKYVRKGQPLADISSPERVATKTNY